MALPDGKWDMPAMAATGLTGDTQWPSPAVLLAVFIGAWVVMVATMMLPRSDDGPALVSYGQIYIIGPW